MSLLVVDASVVVKWFVPEIHSELARELLSGENHYAAPDLLFAEVGNVLWKKVRRGELPAAAGRRLMSDIADIAIESVTARALGADAHGLAVATGITMYDALYVTLAVRLDTVLMTADEHLVRTIGAYRAAADHVRLLQGDR